MPGFLEPIWEAVFKVATWSALIFGALSIGSAFVSAWVGWEITDATQKEADRKIKAADERIAEYQARTAEAELALQKLKNPRHVKPEQMQRLISDLRKHAGKKFCVTVGRVHSDPFAEQAVFANELTSAFIAAGWIKTTRVSVDPNRVEPETVAPDQRGCGLSSAPDGASLAMRGYVARALTDAGVECDTRAWEGMLPEVLCLDVGFW